MSCLWQIADCLLKLVRFSWRRRRPLLFLRGLEKAVALSDPKFAVVEFIGPAHSVVCVCVFSTLPHLTLRTYTRVGCGAGGRCVSRLVAAPLSSTYTPHILLSACTWLTMYRWGGGVVSETHFLLQDRSHPAPNRTPIDSGYIPVFIC